MIDYVLEKTGHLNLYYIGYSQGTTSFYAMLSEKPEYNAKVRSMISLAPIAFISNQKSPLIKLLVRFYNVMEVSLSFTIYNSYCEIFPLINFIKKKLILVGLILLQHTSMVPTK